MKTTRAASSVAGAADGRRMRVTARSGPAATRAASSSDGSRACRPTATRDVTIGAKARARTSTTPASLKRSREDDSLPARPAGSQEVEPAQGEEKGREERGKGVEEPRGGPAPRVGPSHHDAQRHPDAQREERDRDGEAQRTEEERGRPRAAEELGGRRPGRALSNGERNERGDASCDEGHSREREADLCLATTEGEP